MCDKVSATRNYTWDHEYAKQSGNHLAMAVAQKRLD